MAGDSAADPDGAGDSADAIIFLQLVGEKGYFGQAGGVFERHEAHHFAVAGSGPAGGGDKARYRDVLIDELVQLGGGHVPGLKQHRRV